MTEETILYPRIPYMGRIGGAGPVTPQTVIRIEGAVLEATSRFNINFQCGPVPRNNIAIHIYAQLCDGMICLNSLRYGIWDEEQWISIIPIKMEEVFEIKVLFQLDHYKIIINGQAFEFPQRIPYNEIGYLSINGDVSIIKISNESTAEIKSPPCAMKNSSFSTNSQSPCFEETLNDQFTDLPPNTNINTNSNSTPAKTTAWCFNRILCRCCITIIIMFIVSIIVVCTDKSRSNNTIHIKPIKLPRFRKLG